MAITGQVQFGELLKRLEQGISFKTNKFITKDLIETVKQEGDNISLPSNGYICSNIPEYRQSMLQLYDGTFGLIEGVNDIPDDIKVCQASLMDSLHFGYDVNTEEFALYTMNIGLLDGSKEPYQEKILNAIMAKNKVGEAKAFRVDIEYPDEVGDDPSCCLTYKLVDPRKAKLDETNILLVPFFSVYNLCCMVEAYIKSGIVLKTVQDVHGDRKVRCVTIDHAKLKKYAVDVDVSVLKPIYFSLAGFLYAPVLGAPNTTAGVTRIDLFKLSQVKRITTAKEIQSLGVHVVKDPISEMVKENAIITSMMFLMSQDQEKFYHVYDELPRREEILPSVEADGFTQAKISMYLHSLKSAELKKVLSLLPSAKAQILDTQEVFTKNEDLGKLTGSELLGYLKTNVCRVLLRKKDFGLSTVICTNSPEILAKVYGKDYFKYYESFNARLGRALEDVENSHKPILHALEEYGFDDTDPQDFFGKVVDKQGSMDANVDVYKDVVYELYGKKQRKSAETSNILVRSMDAYLSKKGAENYYRYVDPGKIINVKLLS